MPSLGCSNSRSSSRGSLRKTEVEGAKLGAQIAKDKTQKEFDEATRAVDMQIKGVELGLKMGEKMTQQPKGE
jgi:hypothetical protein